MKAVTIFDIALSRGVKESENGGISLGEFYRVGLPMMGGCQRCGACIAAYNACPSTTGYLQCASGCIGEDGFPSVKAYEAWQAYVDACQEAREEKDGESDSSYRDRLVECLPEGHVSTAEEIGDSSGQELDDIGERYNCPRKRPEVDKMECLTSKAEKDEA